LAISSFASAWLHGLRQHDLATYLHSVRVAQYFLDFMRYVGVSSSEAKRLHLSAALHDIGKMVIPLSILQKKGVLSNEEYGQIKKHPEIAFQWMTLLRDLDTVTEIAYLHHERWNGSGYPLGLRGNAIPRFVRLFSVIDVWDAMLNDRPYRDGIPEGMLLGYFVQASGSLFDPETVDAFLRWRRKSVAITITTTPRFFVEQTTAF
jgi:HD-GYP domain-containing protein (c-di-GMP phosphodiesterase class II)